MGRLVALLAAAALALAVPAAARGEALIPFNGPFGFGSPVYVTAPPDDGRLFIVVRLGVVQVLNGGTLKTFLTVPNVDNNSERGLLSLAFPPDYATSGRFYVFTVAAGPDALDPSGVDGDIRIVEYHVSPSDPDAADPSSARLVFKQAHQCGCHQGGTVAFGPDRLLYITLGDNGIKDNGQSNTTPFGKVLRIDPREQPGGAPYGIPAGNPYAGNPLCSPAASGAAPCPEDYAIGLRNPYRLSFDQVNGDILIGDAGALTTEEIDRGVHTGGAPGDNTLRGANLGWGTCEGSYKYFSKTVPCPIAQTPPIFEYFHEDNHCAAVIGGVVVHDQTLPNLRNRFLYGDVCYPDLRTLDVRVAGADPRPTNLSITTALWSTGEDSRGCVYVMADHRLYRVARRASAPFACPNPVRPAFAGIPPSSSSGPTNVRPGSGSAPRRAGPG